MTMIDLGSINNNLIACSTIYDKQCIQQYHEFVLLELFRKGFCQTWNGSSFLARSKNFHVLNHDIDNANDNSVTPTQNDLQVQVLFSLLDNIAVKKALSKLIVHEDISTFDYIVWDKRMTDSKPLASSSSSSSSSSSLVSSSSSSSTITKRKRNDVNEYNQGQLFLELLLSYSCNTWNGVCMCLNIARENAIMALQIESVSVLQRCFCFAELISALTPHVSIGKKNPSSTVELSFDHNANHFIESLVNNEHDNYYENTNKNSNKISSSSSMAVVAHWYSRRNPSFNVDLFRLWLESIFFTNQKSTQDMQSTHQIICISARSFGFCLLVLLEVLRFHSVNGLRCIMEVISNKKLVMLDKNKANTYLNACRHRLVDTDSNKNSNETSTSNSNPLASDITINRIRTWATTARATGQLPAGVAQLCCMGGVSNVILAIQAIVGDIYHDYKHGFHIKLNDNDNDADNAGHNDGMNDKVTLVFTDCMYVLRLMLTEGCCGPINSSSTKQIEELLMNIQNSLEKHQGNQAEAASKKEELFHGGVSDLFQDLLLEINPKIMMVVNEACSTLEMITNLTTPLEVVNPTKCDLENILIQLCNEIPDVMEQFQMVMRKTYSIMTETSHVNSNSRILQVIRHRFASATILSCVRVVALVLDIIKQHEDQEDHEDDEDDEDENVADIDIGRDIGNTKNRTNVKICILDEDDDDINENFDYLNTIQKKQQKTIKCNKRLQVQDRCLKVISLLGRGLMLSNDDLNHSKSVPSLAWTDRVICVKCIRHCIVSFVMHCIQDYTLRLTHLQPIFALIGTCDANTAQALCAALYSIFVPTPQLSSFESDIQEESIDLEYERTNQRNALIRVIPVTVTIAKNIPNENKNFYHKNVNHTQDVQVHIPTSTSKHTKSVVEIMDSLLVLIA